MSFGEILQKFKGDEHPENIVPLIEDSTLRNGVVAWKSVAIKNKPLEECSFKDDASQWNWLWSRVEYDHKNFGIVAGVKAQDASSLLIRLIGLRLIYPDGSVNIYAKQYLQSIIMARLGGGKKKGRPTKEEAN
jgi:hypothetical protein